MNASELAQLAALVAHHSPAIIRGTRPMRESGLEQYWTASRCRLDRWLQALKEHETLIANASPGTRVTHWRSIRPLLDEILLSETLTRVWAAVGAAFDLHHGTGDVEPITRSTLIGHLEARNRALQLIVFGQGLGVEEAVSLNRLRRRVERWTDLMLGYVLVDQNAAEFAFDRARALDFAEDLRYERQAGTDNKAWDLVQSSLQAAFQKEGRQAAACAELNRQIAAAVLGCIDAGLFDSWGVLQSLWLIRLTQVATDAQGMLAELLSNEPLVSDSLPSAGRRLPGGRPRSPRF
jgi:hypothetical protein